MSRSRLGIFGTALIYAIICSAVALLHAQALPTATRPGSYISVGATFSGYQSPYNKAGIAGASIYIDGNVTRRLGLEGEARYLQLHNQNDTKATTYLVGPRLSTTWPRFRPYVKVLVGSGAFTFPYAYAKGSYFVIAPGGGLDMGVLHGRAFIRLVDFEYQDWRDFTFGAAHPYGFSSGLSVRVF